MANNAATPVLVVLLAEQRDGSTARTESESSAIRWVAGPRVIAALRRVRGVGQRENTAGDTTLDPRARHVRRAFSALAALLAVYGAAGCEPSEPHWRHFCRESHTEPGIMLLPNGDGLMMLPTNDTVCDRWDSTWVVPDSAPRRREETTR